MGKHQKPKIQAFVSVTPPKTKPKSHRPYRRAHNPRPEDIELDLAGESLPEKPTQVDIILQRRAHYSGKVTGPKAGESSDAFVERKLEEMAAPAIMEVEYALKFADDKTRLETAKDVLERRGFARNDQKVKNGLPAAPVVVVFNQGDASKMGFIGGTVKAALEAAAPKRSVEGEDEDE